MPYIGTSPSNGVRQTYDYTATAGQTSFSGSDNNSQTLTYTDSTYIDVYQNGILLIPSDYTATTGTTVVLDTGATVSDTLQIVVYDVFSVADTVSASDGGNFGGNLGVGGTLAVTGVPTFTGRSVHSGGITVANAGQIGSVGDADAMAISSGGVVTFSQNTVGAGGMDLLLDSTVTTSGGEVNISSTYINSTYDDYYLVFNIDPATDNTNLNIKVFVGGSILTGDVYAYEASLLSGNEYANDNDTSAFKLNTHTVGSAVGEGISGQLLFQNINDTSHSFSYSGFTNFFNTSGNHNSNAVAGSLIPANRASVVNGIRINMSGGELVGDFKLYGIRT